MNALFFNVNAKEETGHAGDGQNAANLVFPFVKHVILRNIESSSPIETVDHTHYDQSDGVEIADVGPCFDVAVERHADADAQEGDDKLGQVCDMESSSCEME